MAFLGGIWRILVGIKDGLVLLFMLLFFGLLAAALSMRSPSIKVPDGSALVIRLEGLLVDKASDPAPFALLSGQPLIQETESRDLVRAIGLATEDPKIKAIVLDLDSFAGGGLANLEAAGRALQAFRAAGKPVYAYGTAYADDGYFLAAHANQAWVNPLGGVYVTGPGGSGLYLKGLLDKLKVNVEVFRVGTFKSAVEPFIRTDSSPEAREADQLLANDLWASYRAGVQRARPNIDLDAVIQGWPSRVQGLNSDLATLAVSAGLVDKVGDRLAFVAEVRKLVGAGEDEERPNSLNGIELQDYLTARKGKNKTANVGIVHVAGVIGSSDDPDGSSVAELIRDAVADTDVKAIVIRIDSPGGSALASDVIRAAATSAREAGKPVVASMGPVAASGGYWVATGAEWIAAEPTTITGSIGVFGILPTFEKTLAEIGVTSDGVSTTPYSGQPDLAGGLNEPMRDLIQASVVDVYRTFVGLVADARGLDPAAVEAMAEGRVWSGTQALKLKLVDAHGGLDSAIAEAGRRAKIAPQDVEARVFREPRPFLAEILSQGDFIGTRRHDPLGVVVERARLRALATARMVLATTQGPMVQAVCLSCVEHVPATLPQGNDALSALSKAAERWIDR